MKYMGSKKYMLRNGLGEMIKKEAKQSLRIVDLFAGSGSVVWFAALHCNLPIISVDLQKYSTILCSSVIERTSPLNANALAKKWITKALRNMKKSKRYSEAMMLKNDNDFVSQVDKSRTLCQKTKSIGPVWHAYGGHYYSPLQALTIDYLLKYLPEEKEENLVCHAALIEAASSTAAAPGHTAQPFQPTDSAKRFLQGSWKLDIIHFCIRALEEICPRYAKKKGSAKIGNAENEALNLEKGDLVIVDPPYSEVQYSRFYHVLETIARKECGEVSGIGRYPVLSERPQSDFSKKTESLNALSRLFQKISSRGAKMILTFPDNDCSNGLSGTKVMEAASKWFNIKTEYVYGKFSTLGGNNTIRKSRTDSKELILLLTPKDVLTAFENSIVSSVLFK